MGKVAHIVGDMPFAGRAMVENAYFWARSETSDVSEKIKKCAAAAGFLTVFGLIHGVQAKMGIRDFTHDLNEAQNGAGALAYAESTISGLYTLAMSAVTYT